MVDIGWKWLFLVKKGRPCSKMMNNQSKLVKMIDFGWNWLPMV
jgi:hypothetical protein